MRRQSPSIPIPVPLFPPAGSELRIELAAPQQQELIRALAELLLQAAADPRVTAQGGVMADRITADHMPCAPWQLDPSVLDTDTIRTAAKAVAGRQGRSMSRAGDSHTLEIPGI